MTGIVPGARSVGNRLRDLIERTAPQPVIVVQIGIALGAAAAGAMTRRAIVREGAPAERPREIEQCWRGLDLFQRRGGKLGHHRAALLLELRKLARAGAAGMPVEQADAV